MSEQSFLKRRWKLLLNIITVSALLVLIYAIRHQLADTIDNLAKVNVAALLLIVPVEMLNYHSQAKLYQRLFGLVGNKLRYKFLIKASLELNFINHVLPIGGRVNELMLFVAGSLSTLMVIGTCGFVFIIGSQKRINSFFTMFTAGLNRLIHIVRPNHPETIKMHRVKGLFEELHSNYKLIESQYKDLRWPLWYAFLMNLTEVSAVYVVFIAFGHWVNVGSVILAYAVANFAGLVSVLPGGVGIYEALMTAVLAAAGVPAGLSLPVIVMYRVVNTLIQLPPGYIYYHRTLNSNSEQSKVEH